MTKSLSTLKTIGGLAAGAIALSVYLRIIRPWQLRWGATDEEIARAMPGDNVIHNPTFVATRAVTIDTPPESIWPWLLQIGCRRAGWYSYDWIDNLGIPSATRIIPELQHLEVGDLVPMSPDGKLGFIVKEIEPNKMMLWQDKDGTTSWAWGLYKINESQTRLVTRVRIRYNWMSPTIIFFLLLDVGDIVMMHKCMLGIKQRAEATSKKS